MRTPCSKLEMFIPICNLIINRNPTINKCVCLDAHRQMYLNKKKGDTFETFHLQVYVCVEKVVRFC